MSKILITEKVAGYELLDSGENEKLERFGNFLLRRPDPQALWKKTLSPEDWLKADAFFYVSKEENSWKFPKALPEKWEVDFGDIKLYAKLSSFKHTGIFPEQLPNWQFTTGLVKKAGRPMSVLNLFGYTGGATIALAKAGATVCHVDSSKSSVTFAKENAELNNLGDKTIRYIVDDVRAFVKREIKRGTKYDGIIMDPPAFGRGAKGEVWKIEEDFLPLIDDLLQLLTPSPLFFLMSGYASGYSAIAFENNLGTFKEKLGGNIEVGELTIREKSGRLLPAGIFGKWWNK